MQGCCGGLLGPAPPASPAPLRTKLIPRLPSQLSVSAFKDTAANSGPLKGWRWRLQASSTASRYKYCGANSPNSMVSQ